MTTQSGTRAEAVMHAGVLTERYLYACGPPVVLPSHAHEEYQLNLNLDTPGGIEHRGAYHVVPKRQLTVVMPGEVHAPRDPAALEGPSRHLTLYVRPDVMAAATTAREPHFRDLIVTDPTTIGGVTALHAAVFDAGTTLERDVLLLDLLVRLVTRHAHVELPVPTGTHPSVERARDLLHAHPTADIPLVELAREAGLSPFHLARLFTATVGIPPHAYQVQLRVDRAKRLLASGFTPSRAATEAGFFDLSHLTRHFRRSVGVSPGAYAHRMTPARHVDAGSRHRGRRSGMASE